MQARHLLSITGFIIFILFVVAKNNMLFNDQISHMLASKYVFYFSILLIFTGYFLSGTTGNKNKNMPDASQRSVTGKDDAFNGDGGDFGSGGE